MKSGPKPRTEKQVYVMLLKEATHKNGCIIPKKKAMPAGYIQVYCRGIYDYAHRFVYEHHYGKIPKGLVIRHICNEKSCVNYKHLAVGTHMDNIQDKINAERQPQGISHYRSRLTEAEVLSIRDDPRTYAELSRQYGISRGGIKKIKDRETWKHL